MCSGSAIKTLAKGFCVAGFTTSASFAGATAMAAPPMYGVWINPPSLEGVLQRELKLARVEGRARRAERRIGRIRDAVVEMLGRGADEVGRAINREHLVHVRAVEEVERLGHELKVLALGHVEGARQPHVHRLQAVAV